MRRSLRYERGPTRFRSVDARIVSGIRLRMCLRIRLRVCSRQPSKSASKTKPAWRESQSERTTRRLTAVPALAKTLVARSVVIEHVSLYDDDHTMVGTGQCDMALHTKTKRVKSC
jgi:hypothetical protein